MSFAPSIPRLVTRGLVVGIVSISCLVFMNILKGRSISLISYGMRFASLVFNTSEPFLMLPLFRLSLSMWSSFPLLELMCITNGSFLLIWRMIGLPRNPHPLLLDGLLLGLILSYLALPPSVALLVFLGKPILP